MSDLENIKDELLSAYLDDELSPEERARVEERLATDPAARQLLEQLRALSQAVQGLPRESLGTGFRDSIVRRAEQASRTTKIAATASALPAPAPSSSATTQPRSAEPTWTFGRSRRGWVWAAMAVAAGLLIMVFQPGTEQNQGSREVALRRAEQTAGEKTEVAADSSLQRPTTEESAPASAPAPMVAAQPSSSAPSAYAARDSGHSVSVAATPVSPPDADGKPMSPALASRDKEKSEVESTTKSDHYAATSRAPVSLGYGASAAPPAEGTHANAPQMPVDAENDTSLPPDEGQLVVVRVHASQVALQNKTFDKILDTNGIALVPSPADEEETKQLAPQADQPIAVRQQLADQKEAAAPSNTDVILVEAPKDTIFSCLSSLNQDVLNFPGVAVEDAPVADASQSLQATEPLSDESKKTAINATAPKAKPQQNLAEQLGLQRYNRGYVPPQNEALFQGRAYYSFETRGAAPADSSDKASPGSFGGQEQSADIQRANEIDHSLRKDSAAGGARARRVLPAEMSEMQNRGLPEPNGRAVNRSKESQLGAVKSDAHQGQLKAAPRDNVEQLQVLFILSADDDTKDTQPAASPAGGNKAE